VVIQAQLGAPDAAVVSPHTYNAQFTMHGSLTRYLLFARTSPAAGFPRGTSGIPGLMWSNQKWPLTCYSDIKLLEAAPGIEPG
jgi:hypothetical protein